MYPRTHKTDFPFFSRRHPEKVAAVGGENFFPIPERDPALRRAAVMTQLDPGDMLLWDSRTVHCSQPGVGAAPAPVGKGEASLLRCVCFVCMTPRAWASEKTLAQRKEAVANLTTTTHTPHEFHPTYEYACFPKDKEIWHRFPGAKACGGRISLVPAAGLTAEAWALV